MLVREAVGLSWELYPEQYWDKNIIDKIPGSVNVIDVGANVGQFAIPTAQHGHHVISFEANADTCKALSKKVSSKQLDSKVCSLRSQAPTYPRWCLNNIIYDDVVLLQVKIYCAAAGERTGNVSFSVSEKSTAFTRSVTASGPSAVVTVPILRIDDVVPIGTSQG